MKLPRVRISIAGLMGLILVIGAGLWFEKQARKRQKPSPAEDAAQGRLELAAFARETAEVELEVEESTQDLEQAQRATLEHVRSLRAQAVRWSLTRELARPLVPGQSRSDVAKSEKTPEQKDRLRAICDGIAQLRAAESAARADYERERARRLSWW